MKKTLLALGATLTLLAGVVSAQPAPGDMPPPFGEHMGPKGAMPMEMTREQFMQRASQHFDSMDANHDGKLDRAEMRAAHEKMREKREERRERRGDQPAVGKGEPQPR